MPKRIDKLTKKQAARMDEWADKWIEIGLRTGPADRELFEDAAERCYGFANIPWHGNVVWVDSPLVLSLAAPSASYFLAEGKPVGDLPGFLAGSVAVGEAVDRAVGRAVDDAVRVAMDAGGAVKAVDDATAQAVRQAIQRDWSRYIGGQLWAGGWYWGGAWTSFFREVCDLELEGDLWDRARAYEDTVRSGCWWWPHTHFTMVCERPTVIHRELVDPARERGWNSHRLHCETGPAVAWPDGWGVWSWHGVQVPQHVVERPDEITAEEVLGEQNAEVRRVMLERMTPERFVRESGAKPVQQDDFGRLWRIEMADDEALAMVELENSTVERDGSRKKYWLRVPPDVRSARAAVAWSFDLSEDEYLLVAQS